MAVQSILLFLAMLGCLKAGHRIGQRVLGSDASAREGVGALEAATFGLLGLLLGFAFAGAMSRFEVRRQLAVDEVNAIQTAYFRLDLLATDQHAIRLLFRDYLDARIRVYQDVPAEERDRRILEAAQLQERIWDGIVAASRTDPTENTGQVVIPAINDMTQVTTARTLALRTRTPALILVLLMVVTLLSALLAGYSMSNRPGPSLVHMLAYAGCVALTVYVVLDLDDPRSGLVRLTRAEAHLENLRLSIPER